MDHEPHHLSPPTALDRFLQTDPADAGCAETFALLEVCVEQALAGVDIDLSHPRVAAHLRGCDPCAEDFRGLLAQVQSFPG
jgi:hypothetical protein